MKTNKLWIGALLIGGLFTMNGQTTIQTTNLTSFGFEAGSVASSNIFSSYFGAAAGANCTTGTLNTFIGHNTGGANTTGSANLYVGTNSGVTIPTGNNNTMLGANTGTFLTSGSNNVFVGYNAGSGGPGMTTRSNSTYIGYGAGAGSSGISNVFIGYLTGINATGSNKLMIDNSNTSTPLIWGDFSLDQLKLNGKVGIGGVTTFPANAGGVSLTNYDLFVKGGILAEEVRVTTTWADYVFSNNYVLPSLNELECFIDENGHLPNVPSAKQVAEEGISVGEMAKIQQEKIEELTLYVIQQDKQLKEQQQKIAVLEEQQKELAELKALVKGLIEKN